MRISLIIPVYNEAGAIDRCLANLEALEGEVSFELQERLEGSRSCIRLVTAWDTAQEEVDGLLALLGRLLQ